MTPNKSAPLALVLAAAGLAGVILLGLGRSAQAPTAEQPIRFQPLPEASGFARALQPQPFSFPHDHGPHFDYQTEWWYYTGNLETAEGRHFGFQLTFFRRALVAEQRQRASAFATTQIYSAHFAVTDVEGRSHTFRERFSRGAAGLAGASSEPFSVWLEDWRLDSLNEDGSLVRLVAEEGDLAIDLIIRASKPVVAHGNQGLSPKSDEPGNASFYLSYTRMETAGHIHAQGETFEVSGESWFDHEWSTSALGQQAVGWDWFSLQLSDGRELMLYRIRRQDGSIETASEGTLVERDGRPRRLEAEDVEISVEGRWLSPSSGGDYPAEWHIRVPSAGLDLVVQPWLADQEMRVSFPYWEGAVRMTGTSLGQEVTGHGYVELTGYVESMQGVL